MKKFKLFPLLFASLLMLTFASCGDDDDDDNNPAPSNTELLTGGMWTGDKIFINGSDFTGTAKSQFGYDVTQATLNFDDNGTYTFTYDDDDSNTETGTWEFTNDEKSIILDEGTADETTLVLNKLTASELHMEGEFSLDGVTIDAEIRAVR
ncbi:lipocalin family protein [Pontibacter akesuensis]|uniref:Lipocalin-like domain-containing protein n=2 Tax=Pontibacter akesuensis TaxID=388950 RepID=A0A1I7FQ67_9BACT|nr:lipocalin family protein [Pontibacter akesuensis]SFU38301.1 hypothetical protein SAMN04487941_0384 [Pontibacter akesuensis]